jgi:hypothetical protein
MDRPPVVGVGLAHDSLLRKSGQSMPVNRLVGYVIEGYYGTGMETSSGPEQPDLATYRFGQY